MLGYMPSEIARLVFGYLEKNGCKQSKIMFMSESCDIKEYVRLLEGGRKYPATIEGKDLEGMLDHYYMLTHNEDGQNVGTTVDKGHESGITSKKSKHPKTGLRKVLKKSKPKFKAKNAVSPKLTSANPNFIVTENSRKKERLKHKDNQAVDRGVIQETRETTRNENSECKRISKKKSVLKSKKHTNIIHFASESSSHSQEGEPFLHQKPLPEATTSSLSPQNSLSGGNSDSEPSSDSELNNLPSKASSKRHYSILLTQNDPVSPRKCIDNTDHQSGKCKSKKQRESRLHKENGSVSSEKCFGLTKLLPNQHAVRKKRHIPLMHKLAVMDRCTSPLSPLNSVSNNNLDSEQVDDNNDPLQDLHSAVPERHKDNDETDLGRPSRCVDSFVLKKEKEDIVNLCSSEDDECTQSPKKNFLVISSQEAAQTSELPESANRLEKSNDPATCATSNVRSSTTEADVAWRSISIEKERSDSSKDEPLRENLEAVACEKESVEPNESDNFKKPSYFVDTLLYSSPLRASSATNSPATIINSPSMITPLNSVEPELPPRYPEETSPRFILSQKRASEVLLATPIKQYRQAMVQHQLFISPKRKSHIPRRRLLSSTLIISPSKPVNNEETPPERVSDDDFMDFTFLREEVLSYSPIISKMADSINKALGVVDGTTGTSLESIQPSLSASDSADVLVSQDIINDALNETEGDPTFEELVRKVVEKHGWNRDTMNTTTTAPSVDLSFNNTIPMEDDDRSAHCQETEVGNEIESDPHPPILERESGPTGSSADILRKTSSTVNTNSILLLPTSSALPPTLEKECNPTGSSAHDLTSASSTVVPVQVVNTNSTLLPPISSAIVPAENTRSVQAASATRVPTECANSCNTMSVPVTCIGSVSTPSVTSVPVTCVSSLPALNSTLDPVQNATSLPVMNLSSVSTPSASSVPVMSLSSVPVPGATSLPVAGIISLAAQSSTSVPVASLNSVPAPNATTVPLQIPTISLPVVSASTAVVNPASSTSNPVIACAQQTSTLASANPTFICLQTVPNSGDNMMVIPAQSNATKNNLRKILPSPKKDLLQRTLESLQIQSSPVKNENFIVPNSSAVQNVATSDYGTCIQVINQPIMSSKPANTIFVNGTAISPVKMAYPGLNIITLSPGKLYNRYMSDMPIIQMDGESSQVFRTDLPIIVQTDVRPVRNARSISRLAASRKTLRDRIRQTSDNNKSRKRSLSGVQDPGRAHVRTLDFGQKTTAVPVVNDSVETNSNSSSPLCDSSAVPPSTCDYVGANGQPEQLSTIDMSQLDLAQNAVSSPASSQTRSLPSSDTESAAVTLMSLANQRSDNNLVNGRTLRTVIRSKDKRLTRKRKCSPEKKRPPKELLKKMNIDKFLSTVHK